MAALNGSAVLRSVLAVGAFGLLLIIPAVVGTSVISEKWCFPRFLFL